MVGSWSGSNVGGARIVNNSRPVNGDLDDDRIQRDKGGNDIAV